MAKVQPNRNQDENLHGCLLLISVCVKHVMNEYVSCRIILLYFKEFITCKTMSSSNDSKLITLYATKVQCLI